MENPYPSTRRNFFRKFSLAVIGTISSIGFFSGTSCQKEESSDEKVTLLSPDGELVQVNKSDVKEITCQHATREQSRIGIPGKKFVLVADLAKCKNAKNVWMHVINIIT